MLKTFFLHTERPASCNAKITISALPTTDHSIGDVALLGFHKVDNIFLKSN